MRSLGISQALVTGDLGTVRNLIDAGISEYATDGRSEAQTHGSIIAGIQEPSLQVLEQSESHRVRGLLTVLGYKLESGRDDAVAVDAAVANEVNQVALVNADDVMDSATHRRGMRSVHWLLADLFKNSKDKSYAQKSGESLAVIDSMGLQYDAQEVIRQLNVPAELRLSALGIINANMKLTGNGQALDIYHSKRSPAALADIRTIMLAKTAIYTVLNPLQVGMVLAGGSTSSLEAICPFAENIGIAFQIRNDLDVLRPNTPESPKDFSEDIRGGKQTLLTYFALSHRDSRASKRDQKFLLRRLRSKRLSKRQFAKCQRIIEKSGAVEYAQAEIEQHIDIAKEALKNSAQESGWDQDAVNALSSFTHMLVGKKV